MCVCVILKTYVFNYTGVVVVFISFIYKIFVILCIGMIKFHKMKLRGEKLHLDNKLSIYTDYRISADTLFCSIQRYMLIKIHFIIILVTFLVKNW